MVGRGGFNIIATDEIEIKDIDLENLEELEGFCVPEGKLDDSLMVEGVQLWKKWIRENLKRYDSVGKIAYLDDEILGSIQYVPKLDQAVAEIKCLSVKEEEDDSIKQALLKAAIDHFKEPKSYFKGKKPKALVTYPDLFPRSIKNRNFYEQNGFEKIQNSPGLLYYSITGEPLSDIEPSEIPIVKKTDENKALILCNSSCPYCVEETMGALEELRELNTEIPVKIILPFEDTKKLTEIFSMPTSVVINGEVIRYHLLEKEEFKERIREKLRQEGLVKTTSDKVMPV